MERARQRERDALAPFAALLAALHNQLSGVGLKLPPGARLWTSAHFLPAEKTRHRYTAAEVIKRLRAALSNPTT